MKRIIFTIALALSASFAQAQFPYQLSVTTAAYQPLTNGISLNGTSIWKDTMYNIPLGFNFKLGTTVIDHFRMVSHNFISTDTLGTMSGFLLTDAQLIDRGALGNTSASPIRYQITGTAPNRVFKCEWANAGFAVELDNYNTLNDSVNMQIWLYEGSHIVELRYGKRGITNYSEYFDMVGLPVIGYVKDVNFMNATLDKIYMLSGNPNSPTIDSFSLSHTGGHALNAFPAEGMVYRFTPADQTTKVNDRLNVNDLQVFPTVCQKELHVAFSDHRQLDNQIIGQQGAVASHKRVLT